MKTSMKDGRSFTLVELLVALAVVAVLSALLLPAFSSARRMASGTACAADLHSIGVAIGLYAADHDMTLPGPMFPSFGGTYGAPNATSAYMPDYLWTYMSLPAPTPAGHWLGFSKTFTCPAYSQKFGTNSGVGRNGSYTTQTTTYVNGVAHPYTGPFGLMSSTINNPIRLSSISPADIQNKAYWAVSDLDSAPDAAGTVLPGTTPATHPVHSTYRQQLFFDFHVERIPYP